MRKYIAIILIFLLLVLVLYCHFFRRSGGGNIVTVNHWINWNLSFSPSSAHDSTQIVQAFEDSLQNYVHGINSAGNLTFQLHYCPCDSFLTNIDATLTYGSGNSVPPPPPNPNPGPKGDYTLGNNFNMSIPDFADTNIIDTSKLFKHTESLLTGPVMPHINRTIAVIDTGLDTLLFRQSYPNAIWNGNLLWQDTDKPTLFSVVVDESTNNLLDKGHVKHGTAAAEIILTQIKQIPQNRIPQIMSIRAFDDSERGSIYTVSCALSYAIKHHADFINASWGYFGHEDSILKKYLIRASDSSIRIIAAAGNTPGFHNPKSICGTTENTINSLDRLKGNDSLFYPACFAPEIPNLISVSQLNQVDPVHPGQIVPCFYQNYSAIYVTVGAIENNNSVYESSECCTFNIPFLHWPIEGSSFATPVVTAIMFSDVPDKRIDIKSYININGLPMSGKAYTNNGKYFSFLQLP